MVNDMPTGRHVQFEKNSIPFRPTVSTGVTGFHNASNSWFNRWWDGFQSEFPDADDDESERNDSTKNGEMLIALALKTQFDPIVLHLFWHNSSVSLSRMRALIL